MVNWLIILELILMDLPNEIDKNDKQIITAEGRSPALSDTSGSHNIPSDLTRYSQQFLSNSKNLSK